MTFFLAKTDPDTYPIEQLRTDKSTTWDGVRNPQAVLAIRRMTKGDRVFIYHSGGQSAIVGLAEVTGPPAPDPADAKSWTVPFKFRSMIEPPVTLAEIRASKLFDEWALIRQGRLSTMEAPPEFVDWLRARYPALKL